MLLSLAFLPLIEVLDRLALLFDVLLEVVKVFVVLVCHLLQSRVVELAHFSIEHAGFFGRIILYTFHLCHEKMLRLKTSLVWMA